MVDASASFDGNRLAASEASRTLTTNRADLSVAVADRTALASYAEFCRSALFSPAQSAAWIRNWAAEAHADIVVAALSDGGRPVFSLVLEIVRRGPFRIARF